MKYQSVLLGCAGVLILACASPAVAAMPAAGQNGQIEWNEEAAWSIKDKARQMVHSQNGKYTFILTDSNEVQVYGSDGQYQGALPVGPGVAALDVSPEGNRLLLVDNDGLMVRSVALSYVTTIATEGSPFKGLADAPVTMVLFTDFECPYCKNVGPMLDEVLEKNPETVKLVFKNMPLGFHKQAEPSARAALAAGEQGKFWEFHDKLFSADKLGPETINTIATELELDMMKFAEDFVSAKVGQRIQEDLQQAQKAGVRGTPTIFVNGRLLKDRSVEGIQQMVDQALSGQPAQ